MRFLLIFLVVLVLAWRWRIWRTSERARKASPTASPAPKTTDMVRCGHCGMHLPVGEAIPGLQGSYCSTAHRLAKEP